MSDHDARAVMLKPVAPQKMQTVTSSWVVHMSDGRIAEVAADEMRVVDAALVFEGVVAFAPRTWSLCYRDGAVIVWKETTQPAQAQSSERVPRFGTFGREIRPSIEDAREH
jgi:hypothetical protein